MRQHDSAFYVLRLQSKQAAVCIAADVNRRVLIAATSDFFAVEFGVVLITPFERM